MYVAKGGYCINIDKLTQRFYRKQEKTLGYHKYKVRRIKHKACGEEWIDYSVDVYTSGGALIRTKLARINDIDLERFIRGFYRELS